MNDKRKKLLFRGATLLIPVVCIALVWHFAGLSQYRSASDVAEALRGLADRPFGEVLVVLGFAAGAVMFIPVNALIAGVTLSFSPLKGFLLAMGGGLVGSVATYFVGMLFGAAIVELLRGPRVDKVIEKLRNNPFRTSLVMHLLPIGNFTAVNLLAGALRVPFGGFMLGTTLGLLPGVVFFAFLSGTLPKLLKDPKPVHIVLLVLGLALAVVLGFLIRHFAKRGESPKKHAEA